MVVDREGGRMSVGAFIQTCVHYVVLFRNRRKVTRSRMKPSLFRYIRNATRITASMTLYTSAVNAADGREEAARYTVTADRELRFGDVVGVHGNDSCVKYRILSDSISPPVCATFGFHQSVAEVLR